MKVGSNVFLKKRLYVPHTMLPIGARIKHHFVYVQELADTSKSTDQSYVQKTPTMTFAEKNWDR